MKPNLFGCDLTYIWGPKICFNSKALKTAPHFIVMQHWLWWISACGKLSVIAKSFSCCIVGHARTIKYLPSHRNPDYAGS